eukprot:scaffold66079_cov60-Phaeocystis_antarctica.AAC.10
MGGRNRHNTTPARTASVRSNASARGGAPLAWGSLVRGGAPFGWGSSVRCPRIGSLPSASSSLAWPSSSSFHLLLDPVEGAPRSMVSLIIVVEISRSALVQLRHPSRRIHLPMLWHSEPKAGCFVGDQGMRPNFPSLGSANPMSLRRRCAGHSRP